MKTLNQIANMFNHDVDRLTCNRDDIPCYGIRYSVTDKMKKPKEIREYIATVRSLNRKGLSIFSVTERDMHHKTWLSICKRYKNVQISETKTVYHGEYLCWMIVFPNNGKGNWK